MSSTDAATNWDDEEKVPTPAVQQPESETTRALLVGRGLCGKYLAMFAKSMSNIMFKQKCSDLVALTIYMSLFHPIASVGGFDSTSIFDPSAMEYPWFLMTSAILALDQVRNHHVCARRSCGRRPMISSGDQAVSLTKFTRSLVVHSTWMVTIAIQGISFKIPVAGHHKSGIFQMMLHSYNPRTGKMDEKVHKFHSLKQLLNRLKLFNGNLKDLKIHMYPNNHWGAANGAVYRISLSRDCEKELVFTFFENNSGCRVSIHIRDLTMIADIFASTGEAANRDHVCSMRNGKITPRTSPPWMCTIDPQFTRHQRFNKLVNSTLQTYGVPLTILQIVNDYVYCKPSSFEKATTHMLWDKSILSVITEFMGYPKKSR
jgi:hypothetical protein